MSGAVGGEVAGETKANEAEGIVDAKPSPRTVIAAGTELQGTLAANVAVAVEGQFVGDVKAPSLTVAPGAAVRGRIEVDELDSAGFLRGEVRARRARLAGRVEDGTVIQAERLDVPLADDGAAPAGAGLVLGRCTLHVGAET